MSCFLKQGEIFALHGKYIIFSTFSDGGMKLHSMEALTGDQIDECRFPDGHTFR